MLLIVKCKTDAIDHFYSVQAIYLILIQTHVTRIIIISKMGRITRISFLFLLTFPVDLKIKNKTIVCTLTIAINKSFSQQVGTYLDFAFQIVNCTNTKYCAE